MHENLDAFLAHAAERDRIVPRFVERELRAYLECGLLQFGFVRVRCDVCHHERLVAFSCKGRGFCPGCVGRRMSDTAAHLVDRVLPEVPVRQWVLSLPHTLRYRLAYDAELTSRVLEIFVRAVFASLRRRARDRGASGRLYCGAVTFVQRFGDALNLNVHFHSLVLDGVYTALGALRSPQFQPLPPPSDAEVEHVTRAVARRLSSLLDRRGLAEADPVEADPLASTEPLLAELTAASVRGRVATGPRAGRRVQRRGDRIDPEEIGETAGPRCARIGGVSLHADVCVPQRDRARLERLCRYAARPPVATERLSRLADGRLLYRLKRRWRDGTTHVVFEPLELLERLVALIPPPRANQVRYHGVLAPSAGWRDRVVRDRSSANSLDAVSRTTPRTGRRGADALATAAVAAPSTGAAGSRGPPAPASTPRIDPGTRPSVSPHPTATCVDRPRRLSWPELMRRVFATDVLECPRCRGRMRILAAIVQPEVVRAILTGRGAPARAPPAAARPSEPELCFDDSQDDARDA